MYSDNDPIIQELEFIDSIISSDKECLRAYKEVVSLRNNLYQANLYREAKAIGTEDTIKLDRKAKARFENSENIFNTNLEDGVELIHKVRGFVQILINRGKVDESLRDNLMRKLNDIVPDWLQREFQIDDLIERFQLPQHWIELLYKQSRDYVEGIVTTFDILIFSGNQIQQKENSEFVLESDEYLFLTNVLRFVIKNTRSDSLFAMHGILFESFQVLNTNLDNCEAGSYKSSSKKVSQLLRSTLKAVVSTTTMSFANPLIEYISVSVRFYDELLNRYNPYKGTNIFDVAFSIGLVNASRGSAAQEIDYLRTISQNLDEIYIEYIPWLKIRFNEWVKIIDEKLQFRYLRVFDFNHNLTETFFSLPDDFYNASEVAQSIERVFRLDSQLTRLEFKKAEVIRHFPENSQVDIKTILLNIDKVTSSLTVEVEVDGLEPLQILDELGSENRVSGSIKKNSGTKKMQLFIDFSNGYPDVIPNVIDDENTNESILQMITYIVASLLSNKIDEIERRAPRGIQRAEGAQPFTMAKPKPAKEATLRGQNKRIARKLGSNYDDEIREEVVVTENANFRPIIIHNLPNSQKEIINKIDKYNQGGAGRFKVLSHVKTKNGNNVLSLRMGKYRILAIITSDSQAIYYDTIPRDSNYEIFIDDSFLYDL